MGVSGEIVERVCEMPAIYKSLGNVSMTELLAKSGYLSSPRSLTKRRIKRFLTGHTEYLDAWLIYSEDQRCFPAWFLSEPGSYSVSDQRWAVGYIGVDCQVSLKKRFRDQVSATAYFIQIEVQNLAKYLARTKP